MTHPRGAFLKGIEKVIDDKVYHPLDEVPSLRELAMKAEFLRSNGHSTKWLIDEDTGLATL